MKRLLEFFKGHIQLYIWLNMGAILLTVSLLFILGQKTFSPYITYMAIHVLSLKDFLQYLVLLAIYGFAVEFFLRALIQEKILGLGETWLIKTLAVIVPVLLCLSIHWKFGAVGMVYGGILSLFLAIVYVLKKKWQVFAIWHVTWPLIVIPLSMIFCLFQDGSIREDFLYVYKKRHILKEKMFYREGWGWVDAVHYRPDHFEDISKALKNGDKKVSISDGWTTPLKISVSFTCDYKISQSDDELENWAIITGIMLDFMRANETVQEESPWYHANQLSAWQFDDMSSALLCCLDRLPSNHKLKAGNTISDKDALLENWVSEGEKLIKLKVKEEESWMMLKGEQGRGLEDLVEKMKSNWSRTSFTKI